MKTKTTLKTGLPALATKLGLAVLLAAILVLVGLLACRPRLEVPEAGSGLFRFWTASGEAFVTEPLAVDRDPLLDRIEVEGQGPRGAQFLISAREAQCVVPDLQSGRWQINARALNCQEKTAATGQVEVDIGAGAGAEDAGAENAGAFDIYFYGENALPTVDLTVSWARLGELEAGLAGEIELCIAPLADPQGAVTVLGPAPISTAAEASVTGVQLPAPESGTTAGLGSTYILSARLHGSCLEDGRPVTAGGAWLLRTVPRLQITADIAFAPAEVTASILPAGQNLLAAAGSAAADDSPSPLVLSSPAPPLFAGRSLHFSSGSTPAHWYLDGEPAGSGTELHTDPGAKPGPQLLSLLQAQELGPLTGHIQQYLQLLTPIRVGPMVLRQIFARGSRYPPETLLPAEPVEPDGMDGLRGLSGSPDGRYLAAAGYSSDTLLIYRRPADYSEIAEQSAGIAGAAEAAAGALLPAVSTSHSAAAPLDGISDTAFSPLCPMGGVYLLATASKNSSSLILWQLDTAAGGGPAVLQPLDVRSLHNSPALKGAAALTFSPEGRHLYCAGEASGSISVWSTSATEGGQKLSLLAEVPPPSDCEGPADIAISSDGHWAAAAYKSSDSLCIFRRSLSDGQLTAHSIFTDGAGGVDQLNGVHRVAFAVAADSAGLHLYSSSYYDDAVCLFSLANADDPAVWSYTGSWKEFGSVQEPTPAFSTGPAAEYRADIGQLNYSQDLAVSPAGDLLAVAAGGNDALCLWSRDPANGSLSPLAALQEGLESSRDEVSGSSDSLPLPLPGLTGPLSGLDGARSVLWSPTGRRLYCAASNSNALTVLEQW